MSARDDVSEIFDSAAWEPVQGFDFADGCPRMPTLVSEETAP